MCGLKCIDTERGRGRERETETEGWSEAVGPPEGAAEQGGLQAGRAAPRAGRGAEAGDPEVALVRRGRREDVRPPRLLARFVDVCIICVCVCVCVYA